VSAIASGSQHRTMSAINQRMARSLSVSAPINSATYRIGAGSESICRPLHHSHASAFRLQGCQTSRFRSSTSASRRFRCPSMADSAALSCPVGVPPPSACHRQSCRTGSAVQPVSIRRRSGRSDIATCCGRNGRGSCSSTSVVCRGPLHRPRRSNFGSRTMLTATCRASSSVSKLAALPRRCSLPPSYTTTRDVVSIAAAEAPLTSSISWRQVSFVS
jgi:hypothetical protein